jgi:hypothetical protein
VNEGRPPYFWNFRWSRTFVIGFIILVFLMTALDQLLADFEYMRMVDFWIIALYGLFWIFLYWLRPDFFRR